MDDPRYTCASSDLEALHHHAAAQGTELYGGRRYRSLAELQQHELERRRLKTVQNLCFNGADAEFNCSGSSSPISPFHAVLVACEKRVSFAPLRGRGSVCAAHHTGCSCFPSRRYRAALQEFRRSEPVTESDGPVMLPGEEEVSLNNFMVAETEPLWSLVPPHLLLSLIRTPRDAECLLARLREEEEQLRERAC